MELEIQGRDASIYTYQWLKCGKCDKHVYGELEEFIAAFDDDLVHLGYEAVPKDWESSLATLEKCPDLHDKKCNCEIHTDLKENGFIGKLDFVPLDLPY